MRTRSVRIDEETDAIVAAIASFLRRSKQSVMHEAVRALLEVERERIDAGTVDFIARLTQAHPVKSTSLIELRSLPLAQRLRLQAHALQEFFLGHRCANVVAFDLDDDEADGRGGLRIVADFPPGMDGIDRDVLRREVIGMLDCLVEFTEAWRMQIVEPERYAELDRDGIRLTP
jgi:hypothetical protein